MKFDFLWHRARQFRGDLLAISAITLVASLATLAVPWLAGQLLGNLVDTSIENLRPTVFALIAALVTLTALNILATIVSAGASLRILSRLRLDIYEHVQLMPIAFHERRRSGDLIALMTYEVGNLSTFLTSTLANVPSMVLTAGGAIVLLFLIDQKVALVVPLLIPIFFVLMKWLGRRIRVIAKRTRRAEAEVIAKADDDLKMLPAIKAFATEEGRRADYFSAVEEARRLGFNQARINAFIGPIVALLAALAAIAILLVGSDDLARGERTPGELFAFLLYAALLTRPVGGLANIYGSFQIARGTLARLETVLEMKPEPGYWRGDPLDRAKGAVAFKDIHFAYAGRPALLQGIDLSVEQGEIVALTGDNGVGKSTLVKLLLRFYDIQRGSITLDGKDIGGIRLQDLRRQFGYVPQRPLLFNGTIRENIVFGRNFASPEAEEEAVSRALSLAQADEFITRLPNGIETEIGDNGVRLSGGQGQRIALARALFGDPAIYILDEATSMYDIESEAAFVEDCIDALKDRTVIIITHRPASLALADRVLDVRPDRIVEVAKA